MSAVYDCPSSPWSPNPLIVRLQLETVQSDFLINEYPLVRLMEKNGLDAAYSTDITVDRKATQTFFSTTARCCPSATTRRGPTTSGKPP